MAFFSIFVEYIFYQTSQKLEDQFKITATTFFGLEKVLAKEIQGIGGKNIKLLNRAVSYSGDTETLYKSNLLLRSALHVLMPISEFTIDKPEDLYKKAKSIPWDNYMRSSASFAIDGSINSSMFNHTNYANLVVKDAIADFFRQGYGIRPTVDPKKPQYLINLHINENKCTVSLDSSGVSLHKRGYRVGTNEAPINEALAAGLILLSNWDKKQTFFDPMCGSGTFLAEAALLANEIPSGIYRESFGFQNWKTFDRKAWDRVYNDDYETKQLCKILGADISDENLEITETNLINAFIQKKVSLSEKDFLTSASPQEPSFIVTNPPYGKRIGDEDIAPFYAEMGKTIKENYKGHTLWMIMPKTDEVSKLGLDEAESYGIFNGAIECVFNKYVI